MKPLEMVRLLLKQKKRDPLSHQVTAFAPLNIALIKYWGKRHPPLNLPVTESLSLTFPEWGTTTSLQVSDHSTFLMNGVDVSKDTPAGERLFHFLELFELPHSLLIETTNTLPTSAGLASSSSGFAALVKALDHLYGWQLETHQLSLLARLGSGSACRSFWPGFVKWQRGIDPDGLDSHGISLPYTWPDLRAGILLINQTPKPMSSREAMALTPDTSPYYSLWPEMVKRDMQALEKALSHPSFEEIGPIIERQALSLHWLIGTSHPSILYTQAETLEAIQAIRQLREAGHQVYWTQDAGPNLKLFFPQEDETAVQQVFPHVLLSRPFII